MKATTKLITPTKLALSIARGYNLTPPPILAMIIGFHGGIIATRKVPP